MVVLALPQGCQHLRFPQVREQFGIQQLIAEAAEETLREAVFPGAGGRNVQGAHAHRRQVAPHRVGDELRPVVGANELRNAADQEDLRQDVDHVHGRQRALHLQRQALARVLVGQREPLQGPAGLIPIVDEVPAPDVVLVLGSMPGDAVGAVAQTALFPLFLRHLETLTLP